MLGKIIPKMKWQSMKNKVILQVTSRQTFEFSASDQTFEQIVHAYRNKLMLEAERRNILNLAGDETLKEYNDDKESESDVGAKDDSDFVPNEVSILNFNLI